MANPVLFFTEVHLDALYDMALRSQKPHIEMLAAYAALAVNSKGRPSEILIMKRKNIVQEHPTFQYFINRKGPLEERLFYTIDSYKEIEVTRRWLSRHDQATNDDNEGRIWHCITVAADQIHMERNLAPLSKAYLGNIGAVIAKLLHLPQWAHYTTLSFRRLGIMRILESNNSDERVFRTLL